MLPLPALPLLYGSSLGDGEKVSHEVASRCCRCESDAAFERLEPEVWYVRASS